MKILNFTRTSKKFDSIQVRVKFGIFYSYIYLLNFYFKENDEWNLECKFLLYNKIVNRSLLGLNQVSLGFF